MRIHHYIMATFMLLAAPAQAGDLIGFVERLNQHDYNSVLSEEGIQMASLSLPTGALSVAQMEEYLNNITTMIAEFEQHTSHGESSTGRFYLSRPGKLRWEYDPPVPLLVVLSNNKLTMLDKELEQITFGKTEDHLAALLTKPVIRLSKDTKIIHFGTHSGITRLSIQHPTKAEIGTMTLIFRAKPLTLTGIEMEDQNHNLTTVHFKDTIYGTTIDKDLFVIKDPRIFGKKPR
jgi:outer membrane lipoprotein-sorting protein